MMKIIKYEISADGIGLLAYFDSKKFYHIHSVELTKLERWIFSILKNKDKEDRVRQEMKKDKIYFCKDCGALRSKADGGTIFYRCDECWDKRYKKDELRNGG